MRRIFGLVEVGYSPDLKRYDRKDHEGHGEAPQGPEVRVHVVHGLWVELLEIGIPGLKKTHCQIGH